MDRYKQDMNLFSVDLQTLFESLILKGRSVYKVNAVTDDCGGLKPVKNAQLVKFTRHLGIYHDQRQGYRIIRLDRFQTEQLQLQA